MSPDLKSWLFIILALFTVIFCGRWLATLIRAGDHRMGRGITGLKQTAIGLGADFFDTLGIGSFATTTALFKLFRLVPDELIPGTLNVGHTLPSVVQAFIYIAIIEVDARTLASMIAASVIGAWFGAGVVSRWPRRPIRLGMGIALAIAGMLFVMKNLNLLPAGGDTLALSGVHLWLAVGINLVLGALMTLGIGLYAPCMITVALLGMNPSAAFPIMMGSCAFLMPVGAVRFIDSGRYQLKAALGLTLGGVPAVLLAAFMVKSLPLETVRWLVAVVVFYTAIAMLYSAYREDRPR
ncbi:MAG TPA: sulfite exporter TauE/SafE family protein [Gammaproteobacteria bacterium]|nr:sulfite exporter TauE/SafE family protein [Gammaproteobacteria bacterium]